MMMSAKPALPDIQSTGSRRSLKSVFRLLYTYQLLITNQFLDLAMVNHAFFQHPEIGKLITAETMRHYRQTLEAFGCQLHFYKTQGQSQWKLLSHPLQLSLNPAETAMVERLIQRLGQMPLQHHLKCFTHILKTSFKYKAPPEQDPTPKGSDPVQKQITQLAQYCKDQQILHIGYFHNQVLCGPHPMLPKQLITLRGQTYLDAVCVQTKRLRRINLLDIESVVQLASKSSLEAASVTVTFTLLGRLARNYRPYPGETVETQDENLAVTHIGRDFEGLLNRLMKYGPLCQITSPKWAKDAIKERIQQLLQALETEK